MRAPSRTSSTLQRQAFFCYFSGHTYFNLQENSASIQREGERSRARETEREREREREKASPIVYFYAEPCCAYVCVCTRAARTFSSFEKKIQNFLVGWLLAHTPPVFSLLLLRPPCYIYTLHKKMYILGNKGFRFFAFNYLPRVGRVG